MPSKKTTQEVADKAYEAHANDETGLALEPKKKVPLKEKVRAAGQQAKETLKAVGQKVKEDPKAALREVAQAAAAPQAEAQAPQAPAPSYAIEHEDLGATAELEALYNL